MPRRGMGVEMFFAEKDVFPPHRHAPQGHGSRNDPTEGSSSIFAGHAPQGHGSRNRCVY